MFPGYHHCRHHIHHHRHNSRAMKFSQILMYAASSIFYNTPLEIKHETHLFNSYICQHLNWPTWGASRTFFSTRISLLRLGSSRESVRREMREFYAGYRLSSVTILWVELTKRSKEIFCSRNLVSPRNFYDARRTFYASSYEILVEKKVRDAPLKSQTKRMLPAESNKSSFAKTWVIGTLRCAAIGSMIHRKPPEMR